jgi:integrase
LSLPQISLTFVESIADKGIPMARGIERLSALKVTKLAKVIGSHCDGRGLYFRVTSLGAHSWVFRYMLDHKAHEMGLGPWPEITLAEARAMALEARRLKARGIDPLTQKTAARAALALEAAKAITFRQCAEQYIAAHEMEWRGGKNAEQWTASLATYAYPFLGSLPVGSIGRDEVMRVLTPIWSEKRETASRVRGRIEAVLDWARVQGFREGENPARWQGHFEHLLAARNGNSKHFAALPYAGLPGLMTKLAEGIAEEALRFLILTAARTGEALGAKWQEIDMSNGIWTIPAVRMKSGKEHRVPLSAPVVAILRKMEEVRHSDYVFPGRSYNRPPGPGALLIALQRAGGDTATVHGFRSTFSDWAAAETDQPRDIIEMSLAHSVGNQVERTYRRGDLLEKRRALMDAWGAYCSVE